jgi:hypothetical protein
MSFGKNGFGSLDPNVIATSEQQLSAEKEILSEIGWYHPLTGSDG